MLSMILFFIMSVVVFLFYTFAFLPVFLVPYFSPSLVFTCAVTSVDSVVLI